MTILERAILKMTHLIRKIPKNDKSEKGKSANYNSGKDTDEK